MPRAPRTFKVGRRKYYNARYIARRAKRSARLGRIGRSMISPSFIHSFKRHTYITSASTGTGIGAGTYYGIFSPQLSQLPNNSEFGALYDQYRIIYVIYRISWRSTSVEMTTTADNQAIGAPYCLWTLDRDDSNVPTSLNQLREYANMREHYFSDNKRVLYIKFRPNTLTEHYQSTTYNSYSPSYKRWIDINDGGTTPYYGCKFALVEPNSGSPNRAQQFDIDATFYFQMKNPR